MEKKKKTEVNLNLRRPLFFNIGLVTSLAIVIMAFEYKSFDEPFIEIVYEKAPFIDETLPEIPHTYAQPTPPPPVSREVPTAPEDIVEVKIDKLDLPPLEKHIEVAEGNPSAPSIDELINHSKPDLDEKVEEDDPTILFADEMPELGKNNAKFYEYLSKNIRYPSYAQQIQLEGRVIVQFVVDKDGSVTDVTVLKGIGGGCDEEAVRVLKNSPKWQPGKHRGRPVKVKMTMPITFALKR